MYRFYRHGNDWRFIEKGTEKSQPFNTFALEQILGVVGTRPVRITVPQPDHNEFYVYVDNGFITKVEHVYEENAYHDEVNETGAYIATRVVEKTEFLIKD